MSIALRQRRKKDIPAGQPRPHPRVKTTHQKSTGTPLPVFVYPHEIVNVRSKQDLEKYLEHYSHPFPAMEGSPHPKNGHALRYMVEWVFPALRWFCKVYGVDIPKGIQGKGWAEGIDEKDHKKLFGEQPLKVVEWKEDKAIAGQRF